ncbi:MAG: hypothetical protein WBY53_03060 [Acidobacteriaceae bacterium]
MQLTVRELWTMVHGMGFGVLYLLACSGMLVELWRVVVAGGEMSLGQEKFLKAYLMVMVGLAWGAVLTGAYVVYPWYRAVPPVGTVDLSGYPQRLLMHSAATVGWHSLGMEWKEHVAWLAPISMTMVAAVFLRYGRELGRHRGLRTAVLGFAVVAFAAAGVAGFFGAEINKHAPVQGGTVIVLSEGGK